MKAIAHAIKRIFPWLCLAALVAAGYLYRDRIIALIWTLPQPTSVDQGVTAPQVKTADIVTVATGLDVPWEIAFLPSGEMLVTERAGTLLRISPDGTQKIPVQGVVETDEGGLLGVAVHPQFAKNGWIYLYLTSKDSGALTNRVERYRLDGATLSDRTTIIQGIPGSNDHDGGYLAFGPDGMLYVSTGDAESSYRAQDRTSLGGKILRLKDDGTIPADNPFNNAVWSYGHRNVEGFAWDASNRLWATEHGRSGVLSGLDEINLIEPGKNYGWPVIQGDETKDGMVAPVVHSGPYETWAPAGIAFLNGNLYFGGLRGASLYQATILPEGLKLRANFTQEYGRLRAVAIGPDRMIYVSTSNRDGRGTPREGDDKILKFPEALFVH